MLRAPSPVLRKTQPTVATIAVSTTLTPNPTLYKFSVTAASNAGVAYQALCPCGVEQPGLGHDHLVPRL